MYVFSKWPNENLQNPTPSTRSILRKEWHKHSKLWDIWNEIERITGKTLTKLKVVSACTCESTFLFSHKSRVLQTSWCVRLRGYTRWRRLRSSHYFTFFKSIFDKSMCMEKEYYSWTGFYSKKDTVPNPHIQNTKFEWKCSNCNICKLFCKQHSRIQLQILSKCK